MTRRDWYCEDVLSGKLKVDRVWENDRVLAFCHPDPLSDIHVVVIPKNHIASILEQAANDGAMLSSMIEAIQQTARIKGLDSTGFYVRTNTGTEEVTPHMHWHIIGPGIPDA